MADNSTNSHFRQIIDDLASGMRYVTYEDVLKKLNESNGEDVCPKITSDPNYPSLKTFINRELRGLVEFKNQKDASEGFRYKKDNYFYFKREKERKTLRKIDGEAKKLFLTGGLQMLLKDEVAESPLIELECISELKNLSLVKVLYPFLGKLVISFKYQTGYSEMQSITMHPHLLKEFNSRWFLFGYVMENDNYKVVNFSIDRIVYGKPSDIWICHEEKFQAAPEGFYKNYFKDIVGVTRKKDEEPVPITIKTTDYKVHNLIKTKPIHQSQSETREYDELQGGEFTITVIPNMELRSRLLGYGPGIIVLGEGQFQDEIRKAVLTMAESYHR